MTEQEFALRAQDQRGRLYRTAFLYLGGEHAAVDAVERGGVPRLPEPPEAARPSLRDLATRSSQ